MNLKRIPMILTISRMLATFPVAWLISLNTPWTLWIATLLFIAASITDYYDGHLARKFGAVTSLGKFLDPVADKVLVTAVLAFLVHHDLVSPWMLVLFVSRDTIIGGVRAAASASGLVIDAKATGKWKAALQMISIPLLILPPLELGTLSNVFNSFWGQFFSTQIAINYALGNALLWFSVVLSLFSGWEYIQLYRISKHNPT